jgi:hypothetical protein
MYYAHLEDRMDDRCAGLLERLGKLRPGIIAASTHPTMASLSPPMPA